MIRSYNRWHHIWVFACIKFLKNWIFQNWEYIKNCFWYKNVKNSIKYWTYRVCRIHNNNWHSYLTFRWERWRFLLDLILNSKINIMDSFSYLTVLYSVSMILFAYLILFVDKIIYLYVFVWSQKCVQIFDFAILFELKKFMLIKQRWWHLRF